MNKELERLLRQPVQATARQALGGGWSSGTAELNGQRWPCYIQGAGELAVAAYGIRADGSAVLVCSAGKPIKPEILSAAGPCEHHTAWTCEYEHSCGALLFTQTVDGRRWLVIEGLGGHIGFPKGHMELGEDIQAAVARELREEVGITNYTYIDGYRVDSEVITRKKRRKLVTYFLASFSLSRNTLRRQEEELANLWLLPYEEARRRVNTSLDKQLLDQAHRLLSAKE